MNSVDKLSVQMGERRVGSLTMTPDGRRCVFEYDKEWIATGFSISPIELPLRTGLFIAQPTPFSGNFGIFEDSLPDGYGRYLLNRMLRKQGIDELGLTPIQRLSIVGSSGMGALCYVPETLVGEEKSLPALDRLQQMALDVLSEKTDKDEDVLYFNSGNSGGCRPKCLMKDEEGEWLVKFRHTYDPVDMGKEEYRYHEAARRCGINVPDFRLIDGKYFASRRFDVEDGQRLHTATAGALLGVSIQTPTLDYKNLLSLTGYLTQDPLQVEEMFRRMAFNVLAENKDDHPKNFSFICREGKWSLSPAYDLTHCVAGYNGEHATSVNNNGQPSVEDMITVGTQIRISRNRCIKIIEEVGDVVKEHLSIPTNLFTFVGRKRKD